MLASSPGPFPAFQCCTLKSRRRAWYAKSRDRERRSRALRGSKVIRLVSATACKQQKTRLYCYHTSEMQSFEGSEFTFQLIEGMESVKTVRFIRPRLTYFSFESCHVNIDHHDTPHVTSRTRPSSRFSACNIEKLGMGLGTRLTNCKFNQ